MSDVERDAAPKAGELEGGGQGTIGQGGDGSAAGGAEASAAQSKPMRRLPNFSPHSRPVDPKLSPPAGDQPSDLIEVVGEESEGGEGGQAEGSKLKKLPNFGSHRQVDLSKLEAKPGQKGGSLLKFPSFSDWIPRPRRDDEPENPFA